MIARWLDSISRHVLAASKQRVFVSNNCRIGKTNKEKVENNFVSLRMNLKRLYLSISVTQDMDFIHCKSLTELNDVKSLS